MAKTKSEQQNRQMTVQTPPETQVTEPQANSSGELALKAAQSGLRFLEEDRPGTIRKLMGFSLAGIGAGTFAAGIYFIAS